MNVRMFAIASVVAGLAIPASAATVTVLGTVQNGDAYTNVAPSFMSNPVDLNVMGSLFGIYADVYAGTDLAGITPYNSVQTGGKLTYALAGLAGDFFTFIWGTVDTYNTITLDGSGESVTGTDILALLGNPGEGVSNVIVRITADSLFSGVTLTSSGNSFEHAFNPPELAPVPVPAAGLLLVGALGALGAARRRKAA